MGRNTVQLLRSTVSAGVPFAICKIDPEQCDDGNAIRVTHEAIALAKFPPHPNIIKLYSEHADVPRHWQLSVVVEFCAGKDLRSFTEHARKIRRHIPEVFLWHVLYQTLVALEHLDQYQVPHSYVHMGNLLLRPVEGDAYPDVVLAGFEYSEWGSNDDGGDEINDFQMLGQTMKKNFLGRSGGRKGPYSKKLRNFVKVFSGDGVNWVKPSRAEIEDKLIPLAKKQASGKNKTTPQMPAWMIAYLDELKSIAC